VYESVYTYKVQARLKQMLGAMFKLFTKKNTKPKLKEKRCVQFSNRKRLCANTYPGQGNRRRQNTMNIFKIPVQNYKEHHRFD